ncbi:MAG: transposase [Lentisphaeraceae bacterium]|nr:transposase [Lentisphaeraceae bacterium]
MKYKDRRLYALDRSNLNLHSCKKLSKAFGRPNSSGKKKALPQASFTALELVNSGWIVDYKLDSYDRSELCEAKELVADNLSKSDLLIADRLYFDTQCYALLYICGIDFLFRVNYNRYKSFTEKPKKDIEYAQLTQQNLDINIQLRIKKGEAHQPETIPIRYIELKREGVATLYFMTTLTEEELSMEEAAELYHMRWEIETDFRFFKGQDHLPIILSRTEDTVRH